MLVYPDFHDPFILATDASSMALGAVLSQVRDGEERPICYASRQLRGPEKNYSATELELLAVIWATRQFRCYLLGREFN
ncbi:ribonuclease H family protein, partial [Klebsiella pneumoniae]|uniref:ribonuclease H family protein n=1 Tax=Klebsiella pneumoniae TaxID=573 RepID=UPI0040555ECC